MIRSRAFGYVTAADFIVRSAYQMGKTPLLPLFAASLGAGDFLLGTIVSVSTLTGMVLKPFVGILSDRWGRRCWLIVGTAFFAFMPFVYGLIDSPGQLFAVRIIHGTATAIYGPVTLAYVAGLSPSGRAERLGWFSLARKSGYVVGPAAAGWMLTTMDPVSVFTIIGLLSAAAFVPILLLPETGAAPRRESPSMLRHVQQALRKSGKVPAVWLAGGLDAGIYIAVYAAKTFLPLYAVSMGVSVAAVGIVFAIQEAVHMVLNPSPDASETGSATSTQRRRESPCSVSPCRCSRSRTPVWHWSRQPCSSAWPRHSSCRPRWPWPLRVSGRSISPSAWA